jgi:hypothetical protein
MHYLLYLYIPVSIYQTFVKLSIVLNQFYFIGPVKLSFVFKLSFYWYFYSAHIIQEEVRYLLFFSCQNIYLLFSIPQVFINYSLILRPIFILYSCFNLRNPREEDVQNVPITVLWECFHCHETKYLLVNSLLW